MTMPVVQAALVAGPPLYVTVSNIRTNPSASAFTVTFDSDQAFQAAIQWIADTDAPSPGGGPLTGIVNEGGATLHHSIVVAPSQAAGGKVYIFYIQLASTDSSGLILRPYALDGAVQLIGSRTVGNGQALPVRFYQFGGTPPPGAGGTQPGGGGPNIGNWSTYTWAQYNPKRTTYPTP